jgi:hypothetical protein
LKNAPLSDPAYCRQLTGLQAPGAAAAILVSSAIALSKGVDCAHGLERNSRPIGRCRGSCADLGGTISPDDDEHLVELLGVVER